MAKATPPMKVNRNAAKSQAPAEPASARAPAPAPGPPTGPAPGVAVPRLEPTLPEGMRLGAFEIKGVIAHSRAAVIYRVSDHSLGIPAAIKEYMPLGVARRGSAHQVVPLEAWHEDTIDLGRRAFFAESRALARCDDPALLRVTQLWEINGTAYRVMPLYSGKRLVDLRRDMRAPIDEAALRAILERLLDALGAYHASAGVHGNVTPMNILMPALDRPLLLGPGKASVLLATELGEPVRSDFEAAFAAPEQHEAADAAVIGPSADLFGLAQTLRFAITGAAPIGHESLRASIHRLLGAGVVSNYSDALLDALSSATAAAPAERPQSLDEFRQRLRRLEAHSAAQSMQMPGSAAPMPVAAPTPASTQGAASARPPVPPPPPPSAPAPAPAQAVDAAGGEVVDETIDVSSVLGDLMQEPTEPPRQHDDAPKPERSGSAPDPRMEPTLNFAFNPPVPPVHEPTGRVPHAAHSPRVHVEHRGEHAGGHTNEHPHEYPSDHPSDQPSEYERSRSPDAAAGAGPAIAGASDRTSAYHPSMYGDDGDTAQIAASFRPKRSLLASPVLRMTGFVVAVAALAIVLILAVSGVWDPRGPALNLPPTATPGGAALPSTEPDTAPAPEAGAPDTPAPGTAPASAAAPTAPPTTSAAAAATPPSRENNTSRRRAPAAEATSDPREACAGRTQFALYRCMQTQCARPRWAAHPECVRLRKSDRVEPP